LPEARGASVRALDEALSAPSASGAPSLLATLAAPPFPPPLRAALQPPAPALTVYSGGLGDFPGFADLAALAGVGARAGGGEDPVLLAAANEVRAIEKLEAATREAKVRAIEKLEAATREAKGWAAWLYTYRGLSKAFANSAEGEDKTAAYAGHVTEGEDKTATYAGHVGVLEPVVAELRALAAHNARAVLVVTDEFLALLALRASGGAWGEDRLWRLILLLDALFTVDVLKDTKSSINNDFSAYRRAVQARERAKGSAGKS
ncbi:hypothetical protein T484DRAFT_1803895, partial [Baffinella frigidus]